MRQRTTRTWWTDIVELQGYILDMKRQSELFVCLFVPNEDGRVDVVGDGLQQSDVGCGETTADKSG